MHPLQLGHCAPFEQAAKHFSLHHRISLNTGLFPRGLQAQTVWGLRPEEATAEIDVLKRLFVLLPEVPLQNAWEQLVIDYRVSGKSAHDAHLVAAMIVHQIDTILTFNVQDFARYGKIRVLDATKVG